MTTTLQDLINTRRGQRTYEQLSQDCGGHPSAGRLQQMATKPQQSFPNPETLRGLAAGLRVNPIIVLSAFAASFGIEGEDGQPSLVSMLPPGVRELTEGQVNTVLTVIQQMITDNDQREMCGHVSRE
jgi:hypothetical protein